jgi:hypothetical protein
MPRGRSTELDADMARRGLVPASAAAKELGVHVVALYRARESGKLPMVRSGHYWFTAMEEARQLYANNPRRQTWTREGRSAKARGPT